MTATTTPPAAQTPASGPRGPLIRNILPPYSRANTPRLIALAMVALVVAALAWGAVGAWTVSQHAGAAADVVSVNEPFSVEARQLYQSLSDADVTATTAFLSGPRESLPMRQRYQADIAQAGADLAALSAAAAPGGPRLAASLQTVATDLPVYTGYVAQAQADYALGYQLTGGSFMQVASEQMHLDLLPAARAISGQANADLAARSAQAAGLPWFAAVLVIFVVLGFGLYQAQRWLSGRNRRTLNVGLLAASLALTISALWLLASFSVARSDLQGAEAHGSVPAQALAQASVDVQEARGDEILNLISRSGSTSFSGDFQAASRPVGPGAGTLLTTAGAASQGSKAAQPIAAAQADARTWYASGRHVFSLDLAADYAAETSLVIGTGPGSSAAAFSKLESDLGAAVTDDQAVFSAGATAGANAFTGLEAAVMVAAVLMAVGSVWGLVPRLREYG
jgi:hypothetical protein